MLNIWGFADESNNTDFCIVQKQQRLNKQIKEWENKNYGDETTQLRGEQRSNGLVLEDSIDILSSYEWNMLQL